MARTHVDFQSYIPALRFFCAEFSVYGGHSNSMDIQSLGWRQEWRHQITSDGEPSRCALALTSDVLGDARVAPGVVSARVHHLQAAGTVDEHPLAVRRQCHAVLVPRDERLGLGARRPAAQGRRVTGRQFHVDRLFTELVTHHCKHTS